MNNRQSIGVTKEDDAIRLDPEALFRKIAWRIVPLLFLCYVFAYIDRVNVSMAKLQMKDSLHFSDLSYSLGASIFFVGYLLFEIPSNLILEKIGARKTLLRIMVCWGAVSVLTMFVQNEVQFLFMRFLLGAFEAGFFPGVILYLTYWFPAQRRGAIISAFLVAPTLSLIVATPVSGLILGWFDGVGGFRGWQWLFLLSGVPAIVLGVATFFLLDDRPSNATWLTADERTVLARQYDAEVKFISNAKHASVWELLSDFRIYALSLVYFLFIGCVYSMIFWIPSLVKSWGIADVFRVGVYSAIPYVCGTVGMVLIGRNSDRRKERRWHFFGATVLATAGLGVTVIAQGSFAWSLTGLCIMMVGIAALTPLFFTTVSDYVPKRTAAAGIALISSLGNLGASMIPPTMMWINGTTHTPYTSLCLMMALFVISGLLLVIAIRPVRVQAPELALSL